MAKRGAYNTSELHYAIKIMEENPYLSKERFEEYFEKYPFDYYARVYYAMLLTRICKFDDAEKEYKKVDIAINSSTSFESNDGILCYMFITKLKILSAKEKYREMYNCLVSQYKLMEKTKSKQALYYCGIKIGKFLPKKDSYLLNQGFQYSEAAFLDHIKKHTSDYNEQSEEVNPAIFSSDFPIDKVLAEIKKIIPSDRRLFEGYLDDSYYFKYDNCGRVNNSLTNFFKVVCFHNTSNFITMYPENNCEDLPFADLNYLKENEIPKVKALSQVEKFNRRYNFK